MLMVCASCHALAASIPWLISAPFWLSGLLLPVLLMSLSYQVCRIQLLLPDSIVALELDGEDCRPLFKNSVLIVHLHSEAWCSPLFQILYFSIDSKLLRQQQVNQRYRVLRAVIDKIPKPRIALMICADSCTPEQQRQLRKFLRWRVVC